MSEQMTQAGSGKAFTAKADVYGGITQQARPVGLLGAIPQAVLMLIFGGLVAVLVTVVGVFVSIMIAAGAGYDISTISEGNMPGWLVAVLVPLAVGGLFGGWALGAILKTKMEKRPLSSIGLNGFLYGGKFWGGFLGGIAFAAVVTLPIALTGSVFDAGEALTFDWQKLGNTAFLVAIVILFISLMIQAPAEEIVFRGWMFSGVAAKYGLPVGLIVSSLVFGLAHGDRIVAGLPMGIFYISATAGIGFLFAAVAKRNRSVIPAAGMHTGYNFTLLSVGMAAIYTSSSETDLLVILQQMMDVSTLPVPEMDLAFWREVLLRTGVPIGIGLWLLSRGDKAQDS